MSSDDWESLSTGLHKPDSPEAKEGNPGTSKADKQGMTSRHKFDTTGHTSAQPWFFENCDGALAEKIVSECPHMGNTLMRKSTSFREHCDYFITMRQESPKRVVHYPVEHAGDEFELALQNVKYVLKTLDEVMDTFVRETGPSITRPMKSNDLKELGVEFDVMKNEADRVFTGHSGREMTMGPFGDRVSSSDSETEMTIEPFGDRVSGDSGIEMTMQPLDEGRSSELKTAMGMQRLRGISWHDLHEEFDQLLEVLSERRFIKRLTPMSMQSSHEGGQPRKIAELNAHQDHGRGAESDDEQVQPVVSCELTSEESDDSTSGSLEGLLTEEADGTCPVFSVKWQGSFTVPSATGGTFQLQNSEVVLCVPSNAVPIKEAHIQSAVCTDIDYIHDRLHLEDEEEIVSPLVEYKMTEPFSFQKPVSIILPHKCCHEEEDSSLIYVYHVFINEGRTLEKRKLVNASSLNAEEESSEQDILPHFLVTSDDRIITKTKSFSAYFVCKLCNKNANKPPTLFAAVGGKFESEETVSVQIKIWDWRLKCEDFRQKLGNDQPWCEPLPLHLLTVILDTQLLVSLRMNDCAALASDTDGTELTPRQQIIELPHELVCKRCLTKGRFHAPSVKWLLEATGSHVRLAIDINHRILLELATDDQRQGASTTIPCVITREKRDMGIQTEERDRLNSPDQVHDWPSLPSANRSSHRLPVGGSEAARAMSSSFNCSENRPPQSVQLPPPVRCEEEINGVSRRLGEPSVDLRQQHHYSQQRRDEAAAYASGYNSSPNGPTHSATGADIPPYLQLDNLK